MSEIDDIDIWNAAAGPYDAAVGGNWRQSHITSPAVFQLLGQVADQDILDAGCGPGCLSVELARRGARVVGVDGSEQMLVRAPQIQSPLRRQRKPVDEHPSLYRVEVPVIAPEEHHPFGQRGG